VLYGLVRNAVTYNEPGIGSIKVTLHCLKSAEMSGEHIMFVEIRNTTKKVEDLQQLIRCLEMDLHPRETRDFD
jgi:hypothetical protein